MFPKYSNDLVKDAATVSRILLGTTCLFLLSLSLQAQPVSRDAPSPGKRIVIAADSALDGKGGALAQHPHRHRRLENCRDRPQSQADRLRSSRPHRSAWLD